MAALDPAVLRSIAYERARSIMPFVLIGMVLGLLVSEHTGIPLSTPVIVWNALLIPVTAVVYWGLRTRRIPARYGHHVLALAWWLCAITTLASQAFNGSTELMAVYLAEVAGASFMLQTRAVMISFAAFDLMWVPLMLRDGGETTPAYFGSMFGAQVFATVFQRLHYHALVRAETTARALAQQLEERERLNEQLVHAQRMEATGTLAAGLAHDMNNILASITSIAELLHEEANDQARADLDDIIKQSARGAELTRGLLAFSRKGKYRKVVINVDHVLSELVPLFSRTLPKGIEIKTVLDAAGAHVQGDPTQLQQVIVNLGVNASDAMVGKGVLQISSDRTTLGAAEAAALDVAPGQFVRIRVRDTGSGMDEATRRRAFEPFFTTKPLGKGTGLGLSMVWGIVKSHGGVITIDSDLDRGTTFTILLPLTTSAPAQQTRRLPTEPLPHTTVLVVDDEPAVRASTMRLLQRQGLDVLGAENGVEALRLFEEHRGSIGLVVLDMAMPQMGGAECFANLRKTSKVPVLIATGFAVDEEVRSLIAQGAALIEKPFPSAALVQEVRRLLSRAA